MIEKNKFNKISFRTIWNSLMAVVYFLLAYILAFTPYLLPYNLRHGADDIDDFFIARVILASVFFIYGIFRLYQVIKYRK